MKTKLLGIVFAVVSAMLASAPADAMPVCTQDFCYMDSFPTTNAVSVTFSQQDTFGTFVVDQGLLLFAVFGSSVLPGDAAFFGPPFQTNPLVCLLSVGCSPSQTFYEYDFGGNRFPIIGESYDPSTETYGIGAGGAGILASVNVSFTLLSGGMFLGGSVSDDVCNPNDSDCVPFVALGPGPLTVGPAPTPLPVALPLFATGLGVLGFLAKRRQRKGGLPPP